jgi:2-polyprenyl-6-methoxyphenol hydroxylase-like FAD-dependent oxidoreductase
MLIEPIDQYAFDRIVLIGDAAHATTPNLGQGGAMAIEDAVILAVELKKEPDVNQAFLNFEKRRLPRTRKIVNESWRVGKISQLENSALVAMRNWTMRHFPASVNEKQLKFLFNVDF